MEKIQAGIFDDQIITGIQIEYEPDSEEPSRIFMTMVQLIDSLHMLDIDLAKTISTKIEPVQLLQEIETGSLRTWIRTLLKQIDDEALKSLDWRPLVGQYLIKAKKKVLTWLGEREHIKDIAEIEPLETDLVKYARDTDVLHIPTYHPIPRQRFLNDLKSVGESTRYLKMKDEVNIITHLGKIPLSKSFQLLSEDIEDLLTEHTERSSNTLVLLVKKPDYLGTSMWELRYEGHTVLGKIKHQEWLKRFQNREIHIRPGDSIKARVEIIIKRASDRSVVAVRYDVTEVIEIIPASSNNQIPLLPKEFSS